MYVACPGHVCELKLMSCRLGNVCLIEGVSEHGECMGPPSGMRGAKTGSNGLRTTGKGEDWQQWTGSKLRKSRARLASRYDSCTTSGLCGVLLFLPKAI